MIYLYLSQQIPSNKVVRCNGQECPETEKYVLMFKWLTRLQIFLKWCHHRMHIRNMSEIIAFYCWMQFRFCFVRWMYWTNNCKFSSVFKCYNWIFWIHSSNGHVWIMKMIFFNSFQIENRFKKYILPESAYQRLYNKN